jgi:hypothetical protein
MNILPPIPTTITFNNGVVNNEAVRRDNTLRETVPPLAANEKSGAEKGLGSEFDRAKAPGLPPQPVTYERPQPTQAQFIDGKPNQSKDNGKDQSAGRDDAEGRQQEQAEDKNLQNLKQRDLEVRAHEQAHATIGGQYAAAPQYQFKSGSDGRQYAVDGEVSIDIASAATPEQTIRKMQQVKAAALAPAQPSSQDLRVASEASQKAIDAREEIAKARTQEAKDAFEKALIDKTGQNASSPAKSPATVGAEVPPLDEIVQGLDLSPPTRSLQQEGVLDAAEDARNEVQALDLAAVAEFKANRDPMIARRLSVIENFYQQVSAPRSEGLRQSA